MSIEIKVAFSIKNFLPIQQIFIRLAHFIFLQYLTTALVIILQREFMLINKD